MILKTILFILLAAGVYILVVHAFTDGLERGFQEGHKMGLGAGTDATLKLLDKTMKEKHKINVYGLFAELMHDPEAFSEAFKGAMPEGEQEEN